MIRADRLPDIAIIKTKEIVKTKKQQEEQSSVKKTHQLSPRPLACPCPAPPACMRDLGYTTVLVYFDNHFGMIFSFYEWLHMLTNL